MKKIIVKLFGLLLLLNIALFANNLDAPQTNQSNSVASTSSKTALSNNNSELKEVSLDSFGSFGMIIMVVLSSLLGMFFVKDEFREVSLE